MQENSHKAGFINIIGKPNVGKSTLMNALVGEKLSIITSKAQTTRHRIMGIINGPDFQIIYSDTPGIITPKYELHRSMMTFVKESLQDADILLFVTDIMENPDEKETEDIIKKLEGMTIPVFVLLNKIDLATQDLVEERIAYWKSKVSNVKDVVPVSAITSFNTQSVVDYIVTNLPVHPPYFDKDQMTDKTERFFAAEIIREKIFLNYSAEIPYSTEVVITDFKDEKAIIKIRAQIYVERDSQKGIIIGKGGDALKKVGTEARKEMESFFGKKVFLETHVKVEADWRAKENILKRFGYNN
ncbi:MAG TPA: GTPase Era [Cytophagaceae bacterium]|jgi:GTP-binding protein Era|nr:GTPase Era [Cytophagaceae bacterium]